DPPPGLVVELCVLDCACYEGGARDEELDLCVGELARRLGVEGDRADRAAALPVERNGDERLESLFLELRNVLDTRVVERAVANERGLSLPQHPPGEALALLECDPPHEVRVRVGCSPKDELLLFRVEEVHEAGVDGARFRKELDDAVEDLLEVE